MGQREVFRSKMGFIFASVGSAVGMANIWLFPYRLGQLGGAAFLIPYFIFVALIGVIGVAGEMSFGRAFGSGPLGAFKKAATLTAPHQEAACWRGALGSGLGLIPVLGAFGIAIGYAVVVGWILRFCVGSITGSLIAANDSATYFMSIAGSLGSVPWHLITLLATFLVMYIGIARGIERVNSIMMPAFFVLFMLLAVRVLMLGGAEQGLSYLLIPKWGQLLEPRTWVYALGQAFFSLSLAGSGTVVYGSYLSKKEDIMSCARHVAIYDTIAALLAAIVIIPAVFAFGLDVSAGPPLMFITMPNVFKLIPLGAIFAMFFFVAVLFAGISSLMNLLETPVEALQERLGLSRLSAIAIVALIAATAGLFLEDASRLGRWMDIVSIYVIPLGALLAAIMFFWVCPRGFAEAELAKGADKPVSRAIAPLGRYLFCGATLLVYILGILYGGI